MVVVEVVVQVGACWRRWGQPGGLVAGRRGRPEGAVAGGGGRWGARHGGTAAGPGAAIRRTQLGEHGDGVREVGWRGGRVPGSTHLRDAHKRKE